MVPKSFLKTGVVGHLHLDGRLSRLCPCGQSLTTVAATKVGFVPAGRDICGGRQHAVGAALAERRNSGTPIRRPVPLCGLLRQSACDHELNGAFPIAWSIGVAYAFAEEPEYVEQILSAEIC